MSWFSGFFGGESQEQTTPQENKDQHYKEGVSETVEIFASIESCLAVITSYDQYTEFLTDLTECRTIKKVDDNISDVFYQVSVMITTIEYTLRLVKSKDGVTWSNITEGGVFDYNNGSWQLLAIDGDKVKATYTVDCSFNYWVPSFLRDYVVGSRLPATLEAFKNRIETFHREKQK